MHELRARTLAVLGQQHQSRAAAAAGRVLRRDEPRACGAATASRPPSSCRAAISATRWPACGRASMGLPIGEVVLAHNANRTVPGLSRAAASGSRAERRHARLGDGRRQSEQPGAPAGAVSRSSASCAAAVRACSVSDDADPRAHPHRLRAATARSGARTRRPPRRPGSDCREHGAPARRWVLVATAHPAKFREIVEPLIGRAVPVPQSLARAVRAAAAQCVEIDANLDALRVRCCEERS